MADLNAWWRTFANLVKKATLQGTDGDEELAAQKLRMVIKEFLDQELEPDASFDDLAMQVAAIVYELPTDTATKLVALLGQSDDLNE